MWCLDIHRSIERRGWSDLFVVFSRSKHTPCPHTNEAASPPNTILNVISDAPPMKRDYGINARNIVHFRTHARKCSVETSSRSRAGIDYALVGKNYMMIRQPASSDGAVILNLFLFDDKKYMSLTQKCTSLSRTPATLSP